MTTLSPFVRGALARSSFLVSLTMLASCANHTQISAEQESGSYLSRARGNYAAPGPASDPWGPYIREAATKFDVPDRWIREVMHQESGGHLFNRNGQLITSGAGAMGLMQVMPATYDEIKGRYPELGDDPFDPHNNILAGTAYIREMYDIYGSPGFLAAYNAGPGRMDDYLTRNRTLPEETRRYVANISPRIAGASPNRGSPGEQYAMNSMPLPIPDGPRYPRLVGTQLASADTAPAVGTPSLLSPIVLSPPRPDFVAAPITLNPPRPLLEAAPLPIPLPPVQMAQAEEPAAKPIHLDPPKPIQLAALPDPEPFRSEPARAETVRPAPFSTARVLASRPEPMPFKPAGPPLPEPPRPRLTQVAQLPEPPIPQAPLRLAALQPLAPIHHGGFQFVSSANAAPMLHRAGAISNAGSGGWAVQVGAFNNPALANSATAVAREQARDVLGAAHPVVAGVRQPNGMLYRARLTGLSHEGAARACERLARSRTSCMLVSPDAQS